MCHIQVFNKLSEIFNQAIEYGDTDFKPFFMAVAECLKKSLISYMNGISDIINEQELEHYQLIEICNSTSIIEKKIFDFNQKLLKDIGFSKKLVEESYNIEEI